MHPYTAPLLVTLTMPARIDAQKIVLTMPAPLRSLRLTLTATLPMHTPLHIILACTPILTMACTPILTMACTPMLTLTSGTTHVLCCAAELPVTVVVGCL